MNKPLSDTQRQALNKVVGDVDVALGLPNQAYIDEGYFEQEKHKVFASSWAAIGFGKDLPEPLWVKPVAFLGEPLLMTRDKEGAIKVFYNVCRHRGMQLVQEAGKHNVLRCPYHSWCYDHNGDLKITPHAGGPGNNTCPRLEKDVAGLIEVSSYVFMDVVFVNLDGKAKPFEQENAKLLERWKEFWPQAIHHGGTDSSFSLKLNTNWKLAVENYCESYHLPWVHPALNSYSRLEDHYHIEEPMAFSGQGTMVYNPMLSEDGRRFPSFADIDAKWDKQAEYISLYPNVLLGIHKDHYFAILIEPKGPNQSQEYIELYYTDEQVKSDDWKDMRTNNTAMWKTVFEEDIFVVEGMQKGRRATAFDGGVFAPVMDSPTHMFHQWTASKMLAD